MFTDGPVTPLHVESLLSFLQANSKRQISREDIRNSFQPPSITEKQEQSNYSIRACLELGLVEEGEDGLLQLTQSTRRGGTSAELLHDALDEHVLGGTGVEDYFALFYSYMLGLGKKGKDYSREEWVQGFNRDVFNGQQQPNQFNPTKLTGLHRWMAYMGLGWYDQSTFFNCNPYNRIVRRLETVFGQRKKLDCDEFIQLLGDACPELDGGRIFRLANKKYDQDAKQCSSGLSQALVELHSDGVLTLHCPKDSDGWSIASAEPSKDGKTLVSDRISQVEFGKKG